MKPIARWTIGPVNNLGFKILKESIISFSKVYPEFDLVLCHNNLEDFSAISDIDSIVDIDFHEQIGTDVPCSLKNPDDNTEEATGCGWKLSPPRLRMGSHELWIDNDLVIRQRLYSIDRWLQSETSLISAGVGRCRMYGEFDFFVPEGLHLCAGLFGLPPNFDFHNKIKQVSLYADQPLGGFNEQGITAAIVTGFRDFITVPLEQLWISEDHVEFPSITPPAIHFVGANRKSWHKGWKSYKEQDGSFKFMV